MTEKAQPKPEKRKKKSPVSRLFKVVGAIVGSVIALLVLAVTLLVWILTPERLTPLIEKYGSEYLTADVHLERAELTFWSSFPKLEVDLKRLDIISRSLTPLSETERANLPAYADSLLSIDSFHGGLNVLPLLVGKIRLYDVNINKPKVNLVAVNDSVANYNIVPPSEEKKDTTALKVPDITINHFSITGGAPVRYVSLSDGVDAGARLSEMKLDGEENPCYMLDIDGDAVAALSPALKIAKMPIRIDGTIDWKHSEPLRLSLTNFTIGVGPLSTVVNTVVDMSDELTVEAFAMRMERVGIAKLVNMLPDAYRKPLEGLKTNLTIEGAVELVKPYVPSKCAVPSAHLIVEIPQGEASYQNYVLDKFAMAAVFDLDGENIDRSLLNLKHLTAISQGMGMKLTGSATNLLKDPSVEGVFKGGLNFSNLPKNLLSMIPVSVKGTLRGDFDFKFRQSYLNLNNFHRIVLNGDATLSNLDVSQSELGARLYARMVKMSLGVNDSYTSATLRSDSLLTASLDVDTIFVNLPGMTLSCADMMLGAGTHSNGKFTDPHIITPIEAKFSLSRMDFCSTADSMRVKLRDLACSGSLLRYNNNARLPLLNLSLDADKVRYLDPLNRVNFRETSINVKLHPRLRPQMTKRQGERYDSIRARHPHLNPDSVYKLATSGRGGASKALAGVERIDYGLDNSMQRMLRWMDFSAHLTSRKARLFTPYFPVRNRLSNVDLVVTSDSIVLTNTKYKMGRSDFTINGHITNLTRALTTNRSPLKLDLDLRSDTIDVNEIAEAAFAGSAFAQKMAEGMQLNLGDTENEELLQTVVEAAATSDSVAPLLIPINVNASAKVRAKNIYYSDLEFHKFGGDLYLLSGAVNLHNLTASTDMGSVDLSALYSAPTKDDMNFAFGVQIHDLYLEKVLKLIPSIDTLMPLLREIKGVVNADVAATSKILPDMNLDIPSMTAAIKITGDSLVLLDADTFRKIAKWMLFRNKKRNMVDHMEVQVVVENSMLELFPFIFQIDRYKLGVMGFNDLAMNYDYHISVLKSPIPFKFGINVKGNPDKMKIRLGRAKFKENMMIQKIAIVDTTRINLLKEIEKVFRRGVKGGKVSNMKVSRPDLNAMKQEDKNDVISHEDSLLFIKEGLIHAPPVPDSAAVRKEGHVTDEDRPAEVGD